MNKQEFILKYLHNELTDQEYATFVKLVESDKEFADYVTIESILYANHRQKIKKEILDNSTIKSNTSIAEDNAKQKSSTRHLFTSIRNIAALILVAIAVYFTFINKPLHIPDSNSLITKHLLDFHEAPSSLMSGIEVQSNPWKIAIESYKQQKFELAIEQIEAIPDKTNQQLLYLALNKLYSDNTEGAITDFNFILRSDNRIHKDEAEWFLSLAYLKSDQPEKAKPILQNIIKNDAWNANQANELLESINLN